MQIISEWLRGIAHNRFLSSIFLWAGILLLAFISLLTFIKATSPHGIGLTTDSISYIWSAENLQKGLGLGRLTGSGELKPMTHWPPLYTFLIAVLGKSGGDNYMTAKYLGAGLLVLFVVLFVLLARKTSSTLPALIGALILLISPVTWVVFLYALTEPLYLLLMLGAILAFVQFLQSKKTFWLIISSFLASLTVITRYVGVALIATFILAYLFIDIKKWKSKLKEVLLFTGIAILPLVLWLVYNQIAFQNATNRSLLFYPIPASDITNLFTTLGIITKPFAELFRVGFRKIAAFLLLVIWGGWLFLSRANLVSPSKTSSTLPARFLLIFNLIHIATNFTLLIVSRLFFDPMIDIFRERMLFPSYLSLVIVLIWAANSLWQAAIHKGWAAFLPTALLLSFLCVTIYQGYQQDTELLVKKSVKDGIGIAAMRTETHPIARALASLPPADKIFSDNVEVLYLLTNTTSYQITDKSMEKFKVLMEMNDGERVYYVIFRTPGYTKHLLDTFPNIQLVYTGEDGKILKQDK